GYERKKRVIMILLSVATSAGPRLAIKTGAGIVVLEKVAGKDPALPLTLEDAVLFSGGLDRVRDFVNRNAAKLSTLATPEDGVKLDTLFRPRNVICIGLNYKDHAAEGGVPLPEKPVVFVKLNGCIVGPNAPVVIPPETQQVDYEAELAVVIGQRCRAV